MSTLSVVIITRNEEANLPRCVDSVKWADEIIVVDSGSTDRTLEVAEQLGAMVVKCDWQGYSFAKQSGVDRAASHWILSLDADEVITEELAAEIQAILVGETTHAGYRIRRRTRFLGRWIMHCGWYPDPVLRLFQRSMGRFDRAVVHEKVIVDGSVGELQNDMLHFSYPNLEGYVTKLNHYTTMAAREAFDRGDRAGLWDLLVRPFAALVKHLVLRRGFMDGV
ncbi:MAG: glycosyltransferase family 2 protein, partial [candidate division Zixibacteria bacterium]|nr:glycosyltransferase family 2 protein [candidate division Zixibacteria bacterium]